MSDESEGRLPHTGPWIRGLACAIAVALAVASWQQYTTEKTRRSVIHRFSLDLGVDRQHPLSSANIRLAFRGDLAAKTAAEAVFLDWYSAQLRCYESKGSPPGSWNDHRGVLTPLWRYPPPFPAAAGDYASEYLEDKRQFETSPESNRPVLSLPSPHELQQAMSLAATTASQNPGWLDHRLTVFKLRFAFEGSLPQDASNWRLFGDRTGLLSRFTQTADRCTD